MEKLYYDLSESEFSTGRKILVWIFSAVFFLAGIGIIFMNTVMHDKSIHISFCIAPFCIGLFTALVAYQASSKKKDHYFLMDDEKVEYRFGFFKPVKTLHEWNNVSEIHVPHREKRIMLRYNDKTDHIINLTWIEKKKAHFIRRHFFYAAREKNIKLLKVLNLPKK